jgi:hypothetical protein
MNIFAVSDCPIECAKALDNKRLVKMVLETAQLLCGAVVVSGGQAPYKLTHKNHPAAVWTRKSQGNYVWLIEHFKALGAEYTRRFGRTHKSVTVCLSVVESALPLLPKGQRTEFANVTVFPDLPVHEAYVRHLRAKQSNDQLRIM